MNKKQKDLLESALRDIDKTIKALPDRSNGSTAICPYCVYYSYNLEHARKQIIRAIENNPRKCSKGKFNDTENEID